jgi:abequosyltransferase
MPDISFAIPTWNRAKKLNITIENIAGQIIQAGIDAEICVSNNCSDDGTEDVLKFLKEKYGFIRTTGLPEHDENVWGNFVNAINITSGKYVWLFGDDDELLPGGLSSVFSLSKEGKYSVISAGNGWFRPHTNKIAAGSLFNLVNSMGWNQIIGWMTGVILKRDTAEKLALILNSDPHKQSAYSHVSSLLQIAASHHSAYIDSPIVQPQGQQTKEDGERWAKANIAWKYFILIDSFEHLINIKAIPEKVNPKFFRYLNYYIWDRFLSNMISGHLTGKPFPDHGWEVIEKIGKMIDDEGMAKNLILSARLARSMCVERANAAERFNNITNSLVGTIKKSSEMLFPIANLAK